MIKKLFNLFRRKSLGKIVRSFDKTTSNLEALVRQHEADIVKHNLRADRAIATVKVLDAEANHANRIIGNIKGLIGKE